MKAHSFVSSDAESLHSLSEEFNEFTYIVSHDISNPIRGMVEFARLLKDQGELLSEDARMYLELIVLNGERLQRISRGLLEYSRFNTRAKPFTKIACDDIVISCREYLATKISSTKAQLDIDSLPTVMGDTDQLTLLFMILIDNALTYQAHEHRPHIKIFAEPIDSAWSFHIIDNGIGISPKYFEIIFRPLQRLHTDEKFLGAGMGLTIARKIIHRHNGQIWLKSQLEHGSEFIFTLPCLQDCA